MNVVRHHNLRFNFDVRKMLGNFDPASSYDFTGPAQDGVVSMNLAKNASPLGSTDRDEIHANS